MNELTEEVAEVKARVAFRIRQLRKQRGLTMQEVAKKLKTHVNSIYNHEHGTFHHNVHIILKYCKLYNITIAELLEGINI